MGERTETERTKISLRGQDTYDISDHLYGIFLEDIGFSVDGRSECQHGQQLQFRRRLSGQAGDPGGGGASALLEV